MSLEAFFLPTSAGQRFCTLHRPAAGQPCLGAVLLAQPFAEEMNKSRRALAALGRGLAAQGYASLLIDLHGCGDSEGDFDAASWDGWVDDLLAAHAWLRDHVSPTIWLFGLRTGCLLARAAAAQLAQPTQLLFWQPVLSGKQFLQQFFRLQSAAALLGKHDKGGASELRTALAAGQMVEIAGYRLSPALHAGLEAAELAPPPQGGRLLWVQIQNRADATLPPAAQTCLDSWRSAGFMVEATSLPGPAFWQTVEISDCPELVASSLALLQGDEVTA